MNYTGFSKFGFHIRAAVDINPNVIGKKFNTCVVQDIGKMKEIIEENQIQIAMLAVPAENAQETAEKLVEAGIKPILSSAPTTLSLPPEIRVEYTDPLISLQHMTYYL